MPRKLTQEEFITKATKVHGNAYDYSLSKYKNANSKIKIKCNNCGNIFMQKAQSHLSGHNCKCYMISTTKSFIAKAVKTHGNKYDYSLVDYKGIYVPIVISCKKCGKNFKQLPLYHLEGCNKCCYQKNPNMLKTKEVFIKDAILIHKDNYDYTDIIYKGGRVKIKIWCRNCKEYFWQCPNDHLTGYGCNICHTHADKEVNKIYQPLYKTYFSKLNKYQPVHVVIKNNLELLGVECFYCKKVFVPTSVSVRTRLKAIEGKTTGEAQLYCSDKCKQSCKIYGFNPLSTDPDSILYVDSLEKEQTRSCQTNHLKQLQLDEYGYNYCEKCGKEQNSIDLHHTLEVARYGREAISSAGHILLCKKCHRELTKQCKDINIF